MNMDSKPAHGKPQTSGGSSSGDSSPASPSGSPAPSAGKAPVPGGNAFANDGSFMEMFKKKMEEEKRKKETQETGGETRATEQGQASVEKRPPPVTSFVRGLVVRWDSSSSTHPNWCTMIDSLTLTGIEVTTSWCNGQHLAFHTHASACVVHIYVTFVDQWRLGMLLTDHGFPGGAARN